MDEKHSVAMRRWLRYTARRNYLISRLLYVGLCLVVLYVIGIPRLIGQLMLDPASISYFKQQISRDCDGHFYGYSHKFAYLKKAIVNPGRALGRAGGEEISQVQGQSEDVEYFKLFPGFFTLPCRSLPRYRFYDDDSHLNEWQAALRSRHVDDLSVKQEKSEDITRVQNFFTIAVKRYEYANLYHVMTDLYNAYIMMRVFERNPNGTNILLIDGHPKSPLDRIWGILFGDVIRSGHLKNANFFEELVWSIQGYQSPLHNHRKYVIPELQGFTQFVLHRHGISSTKLLDCSHISVLLILRKDYVAHPRNPHGKVSRKISNEQELIDGVQNTLMKNGKRLGNAKGVQMEILDFAEQLKIISRTDILLGMHGSGLSHTLFLPAHAGLIEIFPNTVITANRHFKAMAFWRDLHYIPYENYLPENGEENGTRIVLGDIVDIVRRMREKLCGAI